MSLSGNIAVTTGVSSPVDEDGRRSRASPPHPSNADDLSLCCPRLLPSSLLLPSAQWAPLHLPHPQRHPSLCIKKCGTHESGVSQCLDCMLQDSMNALDVYSTACSVFPVVGSTVSRSLINHWLVWGNWSFWWFMEMTSIPYLMGRSRTSLPYRCSVLKYIFPMWNMGKVWIMFRAAANAL